MLRMALIDHYDSFSHNVLDWLVADTEALPPRVEVVRVNFDDDEGIQMVAASSWPLVLSPGPHSPEVTPTTQQLISTKLGQVPILGVCLGAQQLAYAAGARIIRSYQPLHGSTIDVVVHRDARILRGLKAPWRVTSYNSLVIDAETLPEPWSLNARCQQRDEVQAISYEVADQAPAYGLQFHPEAFLSEQSEVLRRNWLNICAEFAATRT